MTIKGSFMTVRQNTMAAIELFQVLASDAGTIAEAKLRLFKNLTTCLNYMAGSLALGHVGIAAT